MSVKSDSSKLLIFGVRIIAFSIFPLIWFLSQAILFREITNRIPRALLIFLAIVIGSSFIFILYAGMNKIISDTCLLWSFLSTLLLPHTWLTMFNFMCAAQQALLNIVVLLLFYCRSTLPTANYGSHTTCADMGQ